MVEGLLSTMVPGLPDVIEPASLRKASASFVKAAGLEQRHGDTIWRTQLRRPERHPPILKRLLGLQMRRRYILVELKDLAPDPSDPPPDNWFSTLAEWENARWGRDAGRLARLWRTVLESGDEGIIRGFGALRQQLAPGLPEPDPKLMAATPGRRRTMIRHEETLMAARLRELYEELRQEGREEGHREGREEGHREGREEGHREGRRSLLRQLAVQKFGPEVVGELSNLFDQLTDPDRVEALAAAVIECDTGAEFAARARGA